MKITPPADDSGLQVLKQADANREVKETGKLEPYPHIESREERHESKQPLLSEQRQRRCRQHKRRLVRIKTVLNTRDNHERRDKSRRKDDKTNSGARGLDSFT